MIMGAGTAWATDFEFNLNALYQNGTLVTAKTVIGTKGETLTFTDEDENFTILLTRNSGNQPGFYTSSGYFRFYSSDTFKLTAAQGITITKIVITPNGSSFSLSALDGLNTSTKTWTGSASEVTFTGAGTNKWDKLTITYSTSGSGNTAVETTTTINASGITNTDVYVDTDAGSLSATVKDNNNAAISGATVTWSGNNDAVATIDASTGAVTLVSAGTVTFTASYAGESGTYQSSFATYEMTVTDSSPFTGGDVTFVAGTDVGTTTSNADGDEVSKAVVTMSSTIAAFATSEYRFYKDSETTISTSQGTITSIVFTQAGNYAISNFSANVGTYNTENGTWTGSASSVTFTASAQVRASQVVVTVDLGGTADPSITITNNDELAYDATSGSFNFTINNPVTGGATTVSEDVDWISNPTISGNTVSFTTTENAATTSRSGVITLTYTYDTNKTVTKEVTVTQAGNPNNTITTIPDLFAAATSAGSTATNVNVTFGNWVVSGVSGSNVFVTDNNGNGFIIYTNNLSMTYSAEQFQELL